MKQRLLFLVLLLSFGLGFSQTKDSLSGEEKARREKNIQAGNPFKEFGYKPKIATLSKGKYLEFHDLDSIVKIGSFSYHVKKKQITGYTKIDPNDSEAGLSPEVISRWMSPDPLSEEFPSWSPYNFVMNNPIRLVDPDGRAPLDTYGVDKDGNIRHIDNQKYYDKNGNEVDRLYTMNSKYGVDKQRDYVESKVNNDGTSLVSRLSHSGKTLKYAISNEVDSPIIESNSYIGYSDANSKDEAFSVFKYVADNSEVEWSLQKFKNDNGSVGYQLGTYGFGGRKQDGGFKYSPGLKQGIGLGATHSHPGEYTLKDRLESLYGDQSVGQKYKLNNNNSTYQIYFPATGKMREIFKNATFSEPYNFKKL